MPQALKLIDAEAAPAVYVVAGSGSICATLIKYWCTFTTQRLRSAKVRSRPRPIGVQ